VPDQFNPLPYSFTMVLASLWWYYGTIVNDGHMILVNSVGAVLESGYCLLIVVLCRNKTVRRQIAACVVFLGAVLVLVRGDINTLGSINVIVNIGTFATPLVTVREVLRTKNCISFPPVILQCAMTLTPLLWTVYASIINDTFLFIPNAMGIALGSFQLFLRCVYPAHETAINVSGYSQLA